MRTLVIALFLLGMGGLAQADEFTAADLERWQAQYQTAVDYGRALWTNAAEEVNLSTNGVACAQCHPNAANTHPETYPKFQKQVGRVVPIWEMVNWCIRNPLEGAPLEPGSREMIAIQAYIASERKGVPLAPGRH